MKEVIWGINVISEHDSSSDGHDFAIGPTDDRTDVEIKILNSHLTGNNFNNLGADASTTATGVVNQAAGIENIESDATLQDAVNAFNALLASLRAAGIIKENE